MDLERSNFAYLNVLCHLLESVHVTHTEFSRSLSHSGRDVGLQTVGMVGRPGSVHRSKSEVGPAWQLGRDSLLLIRPNT